MKKLVGIVIIILSLTACTSDNTVSSQSSPAITSSGTVSPSPAQNLTEPTEIYNGAVYGDVLVGHSTIKDKKTNTNNPELIPILVGWNWHTQRSVWQTNPYEDQPGDKTAKNSDTTAYIQTDRGSIVVYTYNAAKSSQKNKFVTRILIFDPQTGKRKTACNYYTQLTNVKSDGHALLATEISTDEYVGVKGTTYPNAQKGKIVVRVNSSTCLPTWKNPKIIGLQPVVTNNRIAVFGKDKNYYGINLDDGTVVWNRTDFPVIPKYVPTMGVPEGQIPNDSPYFVVSLDTPKSVNSDDAAWYETTTGNFAGRTDTVLNGTDTATSIGTGTLKVEPKTGIVYAYSAPEMPSGSTPDPHKTYLIAWGPGGKRLWKNTEAEPGVSEQACAGRVWYSSGNTFFALNGKTGKNLVDGENVILPYLCVSATQGITSKNMKTFDLPKLMAAPSTIEPKSSTPIVTSPL